MDRVTLAKFDELVADALSHGIAVFASHKGDMNPLEHAHWLVEAGKFGETEYAPEGGRYVDFYENGNAITILRVYVGYHAEAGEQGPRWEVSQLYTETIEYTQVIACAIYDTLGDKYVKTRDVIMHRKPEM